MIKARFKNPSKPDRDTLLFGLSGENVTRLAAGEPILLHMEELGIAGLDVIITYGKTEEDIKTDLAANLGLQIGANGEVVALKRPDGR